MRNSIDAKMLKKMFLAGTKNLEAKQDWINELNVFPVPDGDTGTNMTLTLMAAVKDLNALKEDATLDEVGKKIASGTLKGARGNSGVILSQLCRGFIKEIEGTQELDIPILVSAFDRAQVTAYKAVMKPKEGTILTVARGIAEKAAQLAAGEEMTMEDFFTAIREDAEAVLASTPDMLPVLKEAGVVDSGGQGLMEFLNGAYDVFCGKDVDIDFSAVEGDASFKSSAHISAGKQKKSDAAAAARTKKVDTSNIETSDIRFIYCTEFIINLEKKFSNRDEQGFKKYLTMMGDSIVCVSMDDIVKVHIHTNDPGLVIQKALTFGTLSRIKIDNMKEEHNERLFAAEQEEAEDISADLQETENDQLYEAAEDDGEPGAGSAADENEEKTEVSAAAEAAESEAANEEQSNKPSVVIPRKEYGFIAVCSGEGLKNVFLNMSVDEVLEGGQTMNPSTEDILGMIDKVNAENIYVLPNNGNIIMAARQAQQLCTDKNIIVIPTKTVAQGITAVINYVPAMSIDENAARMEEAIGTIKTAEITYAVRDTKINDKEITTGDYMGICDGDLVAVGTDPDEVTFEAIGAMFDDDSEIVTIYYGADTTEAAASKIAERVEEEFEDAEVDVVYGGQPIYNYIVSVE